MGNPYFNFKEFKIWQEKSAMKVCTDSCIFGAYVSKIISEKKISIPFTVLDVGAGTGLLSLMLAQKNPKAEIMAIEPDKDTFLECGQNFQNSNWKNRLSIFHQSLADFLKSSPALFDFIICNPPFFLNHLVSPSQTRNNALHISKEDWVNWISGLQNLISDSGQIWLLLPGQNLELTIKTLKDFGFHVTTEVQMHQKPDDNWRNILSISRKPSPVFTPLETQVYDSERELVPLLKLWLSDFYLKL